MALGLECGKCRITPDLRLQGFTLNGYLCPACGHWNDYTRRKWWRPNKKGRL